MIKKILSIFIFSFLISSNANAAEKIAIVDIKTIVEKSKAGESLVKQINKLRNEYQEEVSEKEKEINEEKNNLQKQKNIVSEEIFKEKVEDFQKRVIEGNQFFKARSKKLEIAYAKGLKELRVELLSIIEDISNKDGYIVVIPMSQLLYHDKEMDITDVVLKRLDKKLSNIQLELE